jgi:hypothetical protein
MKVIGGDTAKVWMADWTGHGLNYDCMRNTAATEDEPRFERAWLRKIREKQPTPTPKAANARFTP